jgi:hypothetical protein
MKDVIESKKVNTVELTEQEVKALLAREAKEVLDFIAFLKGRSDRKEREKRMHAQSVSMPGVWNHV